MLIYTSVMNISLIRIQPQPHGDHVILYHSRLWLCVIYILIRLYKGNSNICESREYRGTWVNI